VTVYEGSVFRVSGGQRNRDYSERFISNNLAAIGPGKRWRGSSGSFEPRDKRALSAFYDMKVEDIVLLNVGTEIVAIGVVREKPEFKETMPLIGNWDLFHVARVAWVPVDESEPAWIGGRPNRASHVYKDETLEWVQSQLPRLESAGAFTRDTGDFPFDEDDLDDKSLRELPGKTTEAAVSLWDSIHERGWNPEPSEFEATALLVVPFLLEIGWPQVQLSLEWNWIDVAAFSGVFRGAEDCRLLVEVKRPGMGLDYARGQAFAYAFDHDVRSVPILVTDGFTYRLFENADNPEPLGEVFLPKPRSSAKDFIESIGLIKP
jgi:hypothetical protein